MSVIIIDSVFKMGKNYFPGEFLRNADPLWKERLLCKYIINDLEISSEDSDEKDSNEEMSDKETSDEKVNVIKLVVPLPHKRN